MTLGENIVRLRAEKNWSQGDLADALDVSRQSVSKWETDASVPELEKLIKLADLFGVTLDSLVRSEEQDETAQGSQKSTPQTAPADFTTRTPPAAQRRHTTAGIALLCMGAALFVLVLLLTGSMAGIIFAIPFLLCSVICFVSSARRTVLWCAWALYLCADLYLRYATGLSWGAVKLTHLWTAEMNYMRLFIAWGQFLAMLAMIGATLVSYRRLTLEVTKKRLTLLVLGYLLAFAAMPYAMNRFQAALFSSSNIQHYFHLYSLLSSLYSYLRLALITVLLVRSLAVWRTWRTKKKSA